MSVSYRKNFIEGSGEFNFYYVAKVFCGWDHNIADPAAARLKQKSIYQELAVSRFIGVNPYYAAGG